MAKRIDSVYRGGRSPDWQKLKCTASQELVIGGWTEPTRSRVGLGALLVGYYDDHRQLRYAGKVGTGFTNQLLVQLHQELLAREVDDSPFDDPVREKGAHWARPDLVGAVAFTEWTSDGRLRHPASRASVRTRPPARCATRVRGHEAIQTDGRRWLVPSDTQSELLSPSTACRATGGMFSENHTVLPGWSGWERTPHSSEKICTMRSPRPVRFGDRG